MGVRRRMPRPPRDPEGPEVEDLLVRFRQGDGSAFQDIVGAYQEVVNAITWLVAQNLMLLANDEVTKSLLSIAIAALK